MTEDKMSVGEKIFLSNIFILNDILKSYILGLAMSLVAAICDCTCHPESEFRWFLEAQEGVWLHILFCVNHLIYISLICKCFFYFNHN